MRFPLERQRRLAATWLTSVLVAAVITGCSRTPDRPPLVEVPVPDVSRFEPSVQTQVRAKHATLARTQASTGASDSQRGTAFGEFGMVMHAAEQYDQAEPAYRNAAALMPADPRWPYYLALVRRAKGDTAGTVSLLTRTLELRPTDVAALVGLGRVYLDQGSVDEAEPIFLRAQAVAPTAVAVFAGLAEIALARKDYTRAIALVEEGLSAEPGTDSLHAQLAAAYRGLGDSSRAEGQMKLWRNTELPVHDPLRDELTLMIESGLSYDLRGARAMAARDYGAAVDLFRRGVELAPASTQLGRSLRHKLATALFVSGRTDEALNGFEEVVRLEPPDGIDDPSAKAHYSLGVVRASQGRGTEAIAHFTRAVALNPTYLEAQIALGDALRTAGRDTTALAHYENALAINPRSAEARLSYAIALIRLRRWPDARAWLDESVSRHPDRPELTNTLARLLAAAPDDRVRDGQRALAIVEGLFASIKTAYVGETMAMTLAELGRFDDAIAMQRELVRAARQGGGPADVRRTAANLALYEQHRACRSPWPADDPIFRPAPGISK